MFRLNAFLCCAAVALLSACASAPITKSGDIPRGSEIVVISFRDCTITGQEEDCTGSGKQAAEAFQEAFSEGDKFRSKLVDRPVGASESLSDQAAAELGRRSGHSYVINGEVDDFYSVAAMTFRADRAAVNVRILRVSDGQIMASYSKRAEGSSNFATPKGIIKGIAAFVRNGL